MRDGIVDPHFTEDEELEKLKTWWKSNGTSLIYGAILGLGVIVGVNYWQSYSKTQAEKASTLFETMLVAYNDKKIEEAQTIGGKLMEESSSTPYAAKAALIMARISVDKKDLASATAQLRWVLEHDTDAGTKHAARLRLAYILKKERQLDEALELLRVKDMGGFDSQYKEALGDIHLLKGNMKDARSAYQEAMDSLSQQSTYRELLSVKLNNITTDQ